MAKNLYARLAFRNLRKNGKIYLPYILTCIITAAMFYIMSSLSNNQKIGEMRGGWQVQSMLTLGSAVVGVFALIFLFYTHSFIIKRRKKEFGLLNILGLEKRHIGAVLAFETLYIGVFSITVGLVAGIALDKLMYLIIARILRSDYGLGFFVSWKTVLTTVVVFAAVFALIYLYSFIRVRLSQPIELLKGGEAGEREPKTKWVLVVIGTVCLLSGYICSLCTREASSAIQLFFVAVILVIVGTYFLFTAGSIALLKALRANKKYYYKTSHFTSVSGMTYRMKQNAAGLASICILATMLLVTISTTASFMLGRDDMIAWKYPYDITVYSADGAVTDEIHTLFEEEGVTAESEKVCRYLAFGAMREGNSFSLSSGGSPCMLAVITARSYSELSGQPVSLSEKEVIFSPHDIKYSGGAIGLAGQEFTVKQTVSSFEGEKLILNDLPFLDCAIIVVSDEAAFNLIYENLNSSAVIKFAYGADLGISAEKESELFEKLCLRLEGYGASVSSRAAQADSYMSVFGGLFFLGVYLSLLFLMAAILIIYYKQISEGYEDKKRFEIMQKVGMSYREAAHKHADTDGFLSPADSRGRTRRVRVPYD